MRSNLTRKFLDDHGISCDSAGNVYRYGIKIMPALNKQYHPNSGNYKCYYNIAIYDDNYYQQMKEAKKISKNGYPNGTRSYSVHKVVFAYFYGEVPAHLVVSHKNDNGLDNRLENLELLTYGENLRKRKYNGANQYHNSKNWEEWGK